MISISEAFENLSLGSIADWERFFLGLALFLIGFFLLRILARLFVRSIARGFRDQSRELLRKAIVYIGTLLLLVSILNATGVSVAGLLGAAGVVGIAIGIASQTSLSNIISGLFLVSERFVEIGDVVRVGEHTGIVYAIDLLSIKIRSFDNQLLRIPNQSLIEQTITNITRFPIRRLEFLVTVPHRQSLEASMEALREAGNQCQLVMEEPEPIVIVREQTPNGWLIMLGVWFERQNFVSVRNAVSIGVQDVFARRGLKIQSALVQVEQGEISKAPRNL
ncbi:MAG: mechanosensitive ion channel family protein [Spirochaetaceae bacterium]|nr:MAG: mechanosensitive ion channel family protein [Spirochaetaceae bacterium]